MKPNKQSTNQQSSQQNNHSGESGPIRGPEAASKRDVQEAEKQAQNAKEEAREAQKLAAEETENVRRRCEELQETNRELREQLDRVIAALRHVDVHLDEIEATRGALTKKYKSEPIAEMTGLPDYEELKTVDLVRPGEEE